MARLYTRKRDKRLRGHDKSGTHQKGKVRYLGSSDLQGGKKPEAQKSLVQKVTAFGTPKALRQAIIRKYTDRGYRVGPGNMMLPPEGSDLPAILIPKLSSIANTYRAKTGKARRVMSPYDLGGFIM